MAEGYEVVHLDELDAFPVGDTGLVWHPIRRRLGVRAFGINAYTSAGPGQEVVEHHTETGNDHEEIYFVVSGRARFKLGDEEVDAPAGTLVYLRDPGVERGATAEDEGTTVVAIGARPGAVFTPSPWESWFVAYGLADRGDFEGARRALGERLADQPDDPALHFHLACIETRAGRHDEALESLARAISLDPLKATERAKTDEDFDPIRNDERFVSLVAGETDAGSAGA